MLFHFKVTKPFLCSYFLYLLLPMPKSRFGITTFPHMNRKGKVSWQETLLTALFSAQGSRHPTLGNPAWSKGRRASVSKDTTRSVVFDRGSPTYKLSSRSFQCWRYVSCTEPSSHPSWLDEGQGWTDLFKNNFQTQPLVCTHYFL